MWLVEAGVRDRSLKQVKTIPMEEPGPGVVRHKPNGDIVCVRSDIDSVTLDRVDEVVLWCTGAPHDIKGVLHRLSSRRMCDNEDDLHRAGGTDAKMTISIAHKRQESTYRCCKELRREGYLDDLVGR